AADYPMVYIVSHTWTDRWTGPAAKDIWVYSNCDSVQLFNDYGSIPFGTRLKDAGPRGDTRFQWDSVCVEYNVLFAMGWFNGEIVATDTILLENLPEPVAPSKTASLPEERAEAKPLLAPQIEKPTIFGATVTVSTKGISNIPNLSFGKPAAIFD